MSLYLQTCATFSLLPGRLLYCDSFFVVIHTYIHTFVDIIEIHKETKIPSTVTGMKHQTEARKQHEIRSLLKYLPVPCILSHAQVTGEGGHRISQNDSFLAHPACLTSRLSHFQSVTAENHSGAEAVWCCTASFAPQHPPSSPHPLSPASSAKFRSSLSGVLPW